MSLNVLVLESVGSCIDEDGTVYPMNTDNTPDTNCGVDWLDTTDEWQESLSEEDCGLLNDWLLENNYSLENNDWPDEGIGFSVPEDMPGFEGTWEELESLVDNNSDDGSWVGR